MVLPSTLKWLGVILFGVVAVGVAAYFTLFTDSTAPSPTPEGWKQIVVRHTDVSVSVSYPPSWVADADSNSGTFYLSPRDRSSLETAGYGGPALSILIDENPQHLPPEEFYDGEPGEDLLRGGSDFSAEFVERTVGSQSVWVLESAIVYSGVETILIFPLGDWNARVFMFASPDLRPILEQIIGTLQSDRD